MVPHYGNGQNLNSRDDNRQKIQLEEVNGYFELDSEDVHFESTIVNDVSVSGAGIELPVPLEIGSTVALVFTAGDWSISVEGRVVWCNTVRVDSLEQNKTDSFRMGIKFNPENNNENVMFFMASRAIVNPLG